MNAGIPDLTITIDGLHLDPLDEGRCAEISRILRQLGDVVTGGDGVSVEFNTTVETGSRKPSGWLPTGVLPPLSDRTAVDQENVTLVWSLEGGAVVQRELFRWTNSPNLRVALSTDSSLRSQIGTCPKLEDFIAATGARFWFKPIVAPAPWPRGL